MDYPEEYDLTEAELDELAEQDASDQAEIAEAALEAYNQIAVNNNERRVRDARRISCTQCGRHFRLEYSGDNVNHFLQRHWDHCIQVEQGLPGQEHFFFNVLTPASGDLARGLDLEDAREEQAITEYIVENRAWNLA